MRNPQFYVSGRRPIVLASSWSQTHRERNTSTQTSLNALMVLVSCHCWTRGSLDSTAHIWQIPLICVFNQKKYLYCLWNFTAKDIAKGLIENSLPWVQVTSWHRTDTHPLPGSNLTQLTVTYVHNPDTTTPPLLMIQGKYATILKSWDQRKRW